MQELRPLVRAHQPNRWRVVEDESGIRFLVEDGATSGSHFCLKNLVHMKPEFAESIKN